MKYILGLGCILVVAIILIFLGILKIPPFALLLVGMTTGYLIREVNPYKKLKPKKN